MAQKIVWTLPASRDLEHIIQFIAKDSRHYAEEFLTEAHVLAARLIVFPRRGRKVPELNDSTLREVFLSNYRLISAPQKFRGLPTNRALYVRSGPARDSVAGKTTEWTKLPPQTVDPSVTLCY